MNTSRRSFMASILATACAPAIVKSSILMPIKAPIYIPDLDFLSKQAVLSRKHLLPEHELIDYLVKQIRNECNILYNKSALVIPQFKNIVI